MRQAQLKRVQPGSGRVYYLDNFRTYLTAIVIYHHTAVGYGGIGSWFYKSIYHSEGSSAVLVTFNALNQTYFMASFFFLSSLMSTGALKRKSVRQFLLTRWIKLGIPLAAYTLFGGPVQIALGRLHGHEDLGFDILIDFWKSLRGIRGPVWYIALLLIFDSINALAPEIFAFECPHFLTGMALNVAATFAVRLYYPVGYIFAPLNLQLGYLVQYIASYGLGVKFAGFDAPPAQSRPGIASRQIPLPALAPTTRNTLLATSFGSAAAIVGLLHCFPSIYPLHALQGGPNLAAMSYAVWNEATGYLMGSGILTLFRSSSLLNRSWGSVGKYSYASFLVHPIVLVGAQLWADKWKVNGVLKTIVVGTASVLGSWAVGWALVRVPGVGNLLV